MIADSSPNAPSGLQVGSTHILTPHDLAVSGGSVARLSTMAVFLDKGLPGETLRCRITECKPRFARAEVLETLTESPDATPSFCEFGDQCGGCAWTTLAYPAQLAWKERHVRETLHRIGKVALEQIEYLPITPSPRQFRYRNKMAFAFGYCDGKSSIGLKQRNTHTIIPITDCALCALPVKDILTVTRQWIEEARLTPYDGKSGYLRFLVVRCPDHTPNGTPQCLVECITAPGNRETAQQVERLGKMLMEATATTGFIHSVRKTRTDVAYGEKIVASAGETTVLEQFGKVLLEAPVQAFLQANTTAATLLYGYIREYADQEQAKTVWDIYCGVGGIALSLAREDRIIRGIETEGAAVRFATKNAAHVPGDCAFIRGDATMKAAQISPPPDLIVTDPPRSGLSPETRNTILKLRPARILAVSCDPASLARDIADFSQLYQIKSVKTVDLFPHTPHVETIALLSLSNF